MTPAKGMTAAAASFGLYRSYLYNTCVDVSLNDPEAKGQEKAGGRTR